MRFLAGLAAVGLLLLLTWLMIRSAGVNEPDYAVTLPAFDDFALAQASLRRDVLLARGGLLRDYDPLNTDVEDMTRAVARLRLHARAEQLDIAPVERLAATVTLQERLTEVFKTDNALLQNSLAYFSLLSSGAGYGGARNPATGALAAAILHLTFDSSTDAARAVDDRLAQAGRRGPASGPDTSHAAGCSRPPAAQTPAVRGHHHKGPPRCPQRGQRWRRHARSSRAATRCIEANAQRSRWLLYATPAWCCFS